MRADRSEQIDFGRVGKPANAGSDRPACQGKTTLHADKFSAQLWYLVVQPIELAATAGITKYLGVQANLDMGPKVWQPLLKGLQDMAKNPKPYLTGEKIIFPGDLRRAHRG